VKLKNIIITAVVIATVTLNGYTDIALAASQSEGVLPKSGDLCGGTGGNGQIESIGNNSFTLKLNEGGNKKLTEGSNLVVNLANQATIETSTGPGSLSDLKIGDRVTLVGDSHRDGTFTADAVVLCSATQGNPITVRNKNPEVYKKVSSTINIATILFVGLIWLGIIVYFLLKKRKSLVYLLFFTIFYIYLYKVLDITLLQFQSLLFLKHFVPDLMLNGIESGRSMNLIPLATLTFEDLKTSLLNILMMMPFGFGLPFITNLRFKRVVMSGLLLSIAIEFLQFATGFISSMTFRVADVNDLIFNTLGVAIGYILFVAFVRLYRHISRNWNISANPILQYIAERPQVNK
jgi:glycopeptide antibiotics resistance protein